MRKPKPQWRSEEQRSPMETLRVRYEIYKAAMESLGVPAKSFGDWLAA